MTIERIETSCPCLRVAPWPLRVNAGESAKLDVVSIEDDTPDFQGTLTIDITGFGADGAEVLRTMVRLEFLPGESDRRAPK